MKRLVAIIVAVICMLSVSISVSATTDAVPEKKEFQIAQTSANTKQLSNPKISSISSHALGVIVKWKKVSGAVRYRVFRKEGNSSWIAVGDSTGTQLTDKKAVSNHTYTYTVRCVSKNGKTFTSDFDRTGKVFRFIAAPVVKTIQNTNYGVSLTWNKIPGVSKYRILRKAPSSGWKTVVDTMNNTYIDRLVTSGKQYQYKVRCITADRKKFLSGYKQVYKITFVATPKISSITNSGLRLTIRWNGVAGAGYYRVFYKTSNNGTWQKLGDSKTTSFSYNHAARTSTEIYTVRCMNAKRTAYSSGYDVNGYSFKLYYTTVGMRNALAKAKSYLSIMSFSYKGLYEQLLYEKFTEEEARYGVDFCGADWYEQAAKKAASYLSIMSFSRQRLIEQLEYEGFTYDQAVYGVTQNGF